MQFEISQLNIGSDRRDFDDAAGILSFCVGSGAARQLKEYISNRAVSVFGARRLPPDRRLCGIILIMISFESCDILDIAVDSAIRRKGAASALLEYASRYCKERGAFQIPPRVRFTSARDLRK